MTPACTRTMRGLAVPLAALAALAAGGFLLHIPAQRVGAHERAVGLSRPVEWGGQRDAFTRRLSFLTLGGLRSLTAELMTADATDAWMKQDWPRAQRRWEQITTLAPQRPNYWMRAARDMARNAVSHTLGRRDLEAPQQAALAAAYLESGERFLLDGASANPENPLIYLELGNFYENPARRPQFGKAAEAYKRAVELGAPTMYRRWVFYNLCRLRGREQEAYELGKELFRTEKHRTPSVRCLLFVLQQKLAVPPYEGLTIAELFGTRDKAKKELRRFLHNDLRFPVTGIDEFLEH